MAGSLVAAVPQASAAGGLAWKACPGQPKAFQCATLSVPLDYDQPGGASIGIAAIRHRATDPAHRIGSLFFNPGGPGGGGVGALAEVYDKFPTVARQRFDLVSFDPRGIANSAQLRCLSPKAEAAFIEGLPAGFPVGPVEVASYQRSYRAFARACARDGGPILSHMSTANVARDMDRLRAAVGDAKLTYYGPSYGSYLGATYANLFPSRVRALVLDGNTPPGSWNDSATGRTLGTLLREGSASGSASALRKFLDECSAVSTKRCAFSAGTVAATRGKYAELLASLKARPLTVDGEKITYAGTVQATTGSLYYQRPSIPGAGDWGKLAVGLQALWKLSSASSPSAALTPAGRVALSGLGLGRAGAVAGPAGLGYTAQPALGGGLGVYCSETPNSRDERSYPLQGQVADLATGFGEGSLWAYEAAPCAYWPVTDADRYTGPFDKATVPLLVVGVRHDPATPYEASLRMAKELANTRLLTVSGGGHTALLNKSTCADAYIGAYLVSGALPPKGTVCAQDQAPF